MRKFRSIIIISGILSSSLLYGSEKELLNEISKMTYSNKSDAALKLSRRFLKKYPGSKSIPDVRYMIAVNEKSPLTAIKLFRVVLDNYRYYKRNDEAAMRICEIMCLLSNWNELKDESSAALKKYPKSRNNPDFTLMYIHACINLGDYDDAARESKNFTDRNHEYKSMAKSRLASAYIDKKMTGLSRKYIYSLRELLIGFDESDIYPSALFLAGSFYKSTQDYSKAYSAFSDLIEKYPGSPEALYAKKNIREIIIHKPKRVPYMPGEKTIQARDSIEIKPELPLNSKQNKDTFFSLSVGPFDSFKRANQIKKIISAYGKTHMVQLKTGFILYSGTYPTAEKALLGRIRLAEEEGINGKIVRVHTDGSKKYIYGE